MGAQEDVAVVRRGYEAFNTGDMKTLTELFDESASWHTPGRGSLAGDHEGREATFAYFGQLGGGGGDGRDLPGQIAALACG
jgi:ketosteroid isomerase-like protein